MGLVRFGFVIRCYDTSTVTANCMVNQYSTYSRNKLKLFRNMGFVSTSLFWKMIQAKSHNYNITLHVLNWVIWLSIYSSDIWFVS